MGFSLLAQLVTLCLYVSFMGFCFCDGFKLHTLRKLIWHITFVALAIYTLKTKGDFDLPFVLSITLLLAILLCAYEKNKSKKIA